MDDAFPVGIIKRQRAFEDNPDNAMQWQQLADRHELVERRSVDIFHDDVGLLGFDHRIVDPDNVGVVKPPTDAAFGLEQLHQAPRHGSVVAPS